MMKSVAIVNKRHAFRLAGRQDKANRAGRGRPVMREEAHGAEGRTGFGQAFGAAWVVLFGKKEFGRGAFSLCGLP
jgi:hypothetical protein